MITTSVCSCSIAADLVSQLVCFLWRRERREKMENMCSQQFLFFLGPLVSFFSLVLKAIPGHCPSLSNHPHIIFLLFLSFSITLYSSVLSESASICLFISVAKLMCVNPGLMCLCACVFSCVWHSSYWTLTINLWPAQSPRVKHSDIK